MYEWCLPRAYGRPKIHKPNNPLSIIVSYTNSPLYKLSLFLHKLIYDNIPPANSKVANSFHLVSNAPFNRISNHYKLFSLDAVSLFTNILIDLAINGIVDRWEYISKSTKIPRDEFVEVIVLVMNSTFFTF